jgi:hydrogenase maturation protease
LLEPLEKLIEAPHDHKGTPRKAGSPQPRGSVRASGSEVRRRIVVGCVGNVLRRDDGFGPAVAARLQDLPKGVEVVESGIGGVALLQELMAGAEGLVVVDAVDRGAEPGTVFVLSPDVADYDHVPDVHLANPDRVLSMAREMGCLPSQVVVVGCQPADADGLGEGLTPPVERAVGPAADQVRETVEAWLAEALPPGPPER